MSSMIYKKKTPLLLFLIPAFAFLITYLYDPFLQNILNTFLNKGGMINQLLLNMGLLESEVKTSGKVIVQRLDWKDENRFLFTMFLPMIWQYVGFYFVILIASFEQIRSQQHPSTGYRR